MSYKSVLRFGVTACLIAALLLCLAPPSANAQSSKLTVSVPFEFYVIGKKLPAGVYSLRPNLAGAIVMSDVKTGRPITMVNTVPGSYKATGPTAVVFNRFDDYYFLSEIRWENFEVGRSLPRSTLEVEVAKTTPKRVITVTSNQR